MDEKVTEICQILTRANGNTYLMKSKYFRGHQGVYSPRSPHLLSLTSVRRIAASPALAP